MNKIERAIIYILRAAFVGLAIFFLVRILVDPNYNKWGGVIAGLALPFLPPVVEKVYKSHISFRIQLVYYVFLFISLDLGICLDWYKTAPFFDKIVHFGSGVLSALVGYYALVYFKVMKNPRGFKILFIVSLCMLVAVGWECFEFCCDKFLGQHMQQLVSVGVDDTMFDLLAAAAGSIIGAALMTTPRFVKMLEKN
ncbi:DUF2238 domain-containing protein [Candidatus Saccharibacteria bacterium]|nr:DUF2238 domain-containing protein [Candidatus Saccharibacteria bacterium]